MARAAGDRRRRQRRHADEPRRRERAEHPGGDRRGRPPLPRGRRRGRARARPRRRTAEHGRPRGVPRHHHADPRAHRHPRPDDERHRRPARPGDRRADLAVRRRTARARHPRPEPRPLRRRRRLDRLLAPRGRLSGRDAVHELAALPQGDDPGGLREGVDARVRDRRRARAAPARRGTRTSGIFDRDATYVWLLFGGGLGFTPGDPEWLVYLRNRRRAPVPERALGRARGRPTTSPSPRWDLDGLHDRAARLRGRRLPARRRVAERNHHLVEKLVGSRRSSAAARRRRTRRGRSWGSTAPRSPRDRRQGRRGRGAPRSDRGRRVPPRRRRAGAGDRVHQPVRQGRALAGALPALRPGRSERAHGLGDAQPVWWVERGYALVRADGRGTGKSPGRLDLFGPETPRTSTT